jgi:hypothetical protein
MTGDFAAGVVALSAIAVVDVDFGGTAIGSLRVNNSGTMTYVGSASSGPAAWYSPTGGTPGDNYYASMTLDSGDAWTTGTASGTGIALTSNRTWEWSRPPTGTLAATATLRIATDLGMTNVVASASVTVDVESA